MVRKTDSQIFEILVIKKVANCVHVNNSGGEVVGYKADDGNDNNDDNGDSYDNNSDEENDDVLGEDSDDQSDNDNNGDNGDDDDDEIDAKRFEMKRIISRQSFPSLQCQHHCGKPKYYKIANVASDMFLCTRSFLHQRYNFTDRKKCIYMFPHYFIP